MFTKPTNGSTANYPTQVGRLIDLAEGPPRRNFIRNGDFQIAQRGAAPGAQSSLAYVLDGWLCGGTGTAGTTSLTQQPIAPGTALGSGLPRFSAQISRTVAGSVDNDVLQSRIEFPERLSGKTVTVSFWANCGVGTKTLVLNLASAGGVTPVITTSDNLVNLTAVNQLFQFTINVPAITAAPLGSFLGLRFLERAPYSTFTLNIADIQLEFGNEATLFERLNYEDQLRWNQRYLPGFQSGSTQSLIPGAGYGAAGGTLMTLALPFQTRARVTPTGIAMSNQGHLTLADGTGSIVGTAVAFSYAGVDAGALTVTVAAGITQYRPYTGFFNNASAWLVFTGAEL